MNLVSSNAVAEKPPPLVPSPRLQTLLDHLGAERFSVRDSATRELAKMEASRAYVELLTRSSDIEIATRAGRILDEQDVAFAKTRLDRYFRYGKSGQVDRMVEGLTRWRGPIDKESLWQAVREVATEITDKQGYMETLHRPHDFLAALKKVKTEPKFLRVSDSWKGHMQHGGYVSGAPISAGHIGNCTLLASGSVVANKSASVCIVLTNGDFACANEPNSRASSLVVVSAGRVVLRRDVQNSFVIARDGIDATACDSVSDSCLTSSGKIDGMEKSDAKRRFKSLPLQAKPLNFVQWFDLAVVGFDGASVEVGLKVAAVTAESVAHRAGLHSGDVIQQIDGEPVKASKEKFRDQLRRGSVQDVCELTVLRAGKTTSIFLDFRADNLK
jgi:hypothetical protein